MTTDCRLSLPGSGNFLIFCQHEARLREVGCSIEHFEKFAPVVERHDLSAYTQQGVESDVAAVGVDGRRDREHADGCAFADGEILGSIV